MYEITEADATGRVAEIYGDIRDTLDMSFVNTIWRNIALHDGALEWVWQSVKPIYESGAADYYGTQLRNNLNIPNLPEIPSSALRILGLKTEDSLEISSLFKDLAYSNAQNILVFKALFSEPSHREEPQKYPNLKRDTVSQKTPINLENLSDIEKDLFDRISSIGGEGNVGFPPMWVRGLAKWPSSMPVAWVLLTTLHAEGVIEILKKDVLKKSLEYSSDLARYIVNKPVSNKNNEVISTLKKLTEIGIPRALPVCMVLEKAFSEKQLRPNR